MINETNRVLFLLVLVLGILPGCGSHRALQQAAAPDDHLQRVFDHATDLIDQRAYAEAAHAYRRFIERYPDHAYTDDAAYRLAYLHVTADPANPLRDYEKARTLFQNFIETYQNSRYISACINWLAVLQPRIGQSSPDAPETADIMQLRQQISDLKSENQKLRTTLAELQQAIER